MRVQCLLRYAVCYNIARDYFSLFRAYAGNGVIIRERARNREKTLLLALHAVSCGPFHPGIIHGLISHL